MKIIRKSSRFAILFLAALMMVGGSGCGTKDFKPSKIFSLDSSWPFHDSDEPEEGIPVRIVSAWTDTVKTTPGQPAQRGFGGRLMFYDANDDKPILVDGQLVVYAFDEAGRAPTDNKPTRRYVFPPDQVKLHMSKNDMGASYSFWLPWDEAGGPRADVSLICRFEPKGGAVITGEQTRHILPGTMPMETPGATASAPRVPEGVPVRPAQMSLEAYQAQQRLQTGVQTAGYEAAIAPQPAAPEAAVGAAVPGRQMSVTSIALPNNFQLPEGTSAQPIPTAANQANRLRQVPQSAAAAQYQPPYQQPAMPMQPVQQAAPPPTSNGAAVMQQAPMGAGHFLQPTAPLPRPTMSPINVSGVSVPQNQTYAAPMTAPQYAAQQPVMMQAAQPMYSQQQATAMPQQPATVPMRQIAAPPSQPTVPPQYYQQPGYPQAGYQQPGYSQAPSSNGVRTAVNYGQAPATIPWR